MEDKNLYILLAGRTLIANETESNPDILIEILTGFCFNEEVAGQLKELIKE